MTEAVDIVIVGAGAAGLTAAIWAGRTAPGRTVLALDGARKLGMKLLVSGGGRCNVTFHEVSGDAFAGSSPHAIRKVLQQFGLLRTIRFFREIGVELKQEETGKLFPTTDSARTVLDALVRAAAGAGVTIRHPCRVEAIRRIQGGYSVSGSWGEVRARRVILASGGQSLPRSGSDGYGYKLATDLGHTTTRTFPALVPLILPRGFFIRELSGLSARVTLELRSGSGKRIAAFTDSLLCTRFGVSGPVALNISRYYIDAINGDAGASLTVNWLPGERLEDVDAMLRLPGRKSLGRLLRSRLAERLARALCAESGVDPSVPGHQLRREQRRLLAEALVAMPLPVCGDRGFGSAEVTAGGVPLRELNLRTMESRLSPGLRLCGEICDVDGPVGGFNLQWAWSSGCVAGRSAGVSADPRAQGREDRAPRPR